MSQPKPLPRMPDVSIDDIHEETSLKETVS